MQPLVSNIAIEAQRDIQCRALEETTNLILELLSLDLFILFKRWESITVHCTCFVLCITSLAPYVANCAPIGGALCLGNLISLFHYNSLIFSCDENVHLKKRMFSFPQIKAHTHSRLVRTLNKAISSIASAMSGKTAMNHTVIAGSLSWQSHFPLVMKSISCASLFKVTYLSDITKMTM